MHLTEEASPRDVGFTLVELTIAMALASIIAALTAGLMITGMRSTKQAQVRSSSSQDVQREVERIARDLRVADPLRTTSATSAVLDLYRGGTCVRRTYSLASGTLSVTSVTYAAWTACAAYPATATPTSSSTGTLLTGVPAGTTLFSYRDSNGQTLGSPTPATVRTVTVSLAQTPSSGGTARLSTTVGLRNATLR